MKRSFRIAASLLLAVPLVALIAIKLLYGGGRPYPDVGSAPVVPEAAVETLVSLDFPPGNVTVSADGRIFFGYHPLAQAHRYSQATMFELVDGRPQPYPSLEHQRRYQGVFGMTVDRQNRLWLIEPASLDYQQTRLTGFDLATNKVIFEYSFPKGVARFAQDLRMSHDGTTLFLADTGLFKFTRPGLIVFDLATRKHRVVLERHPSLQPQDWVIRTVLGPHKLAHGLVNFNVGLDGIEISRDGAWLYYGAMSHDHLYRIPVAALRDPALTDEQLAAKIETIGRKPLSDGIAIDDAGRVLITDIEHGGIVRMDARGRLETLTRSRSVIWADGVAVDPDGRVLYTDSALPAYVDQFARPPLQERLQAGAPYRILRFTPPHEE